MHVIVALPDRFAEMLETLTEPPLLAELVVPEHWYVPARFAFPPHADWYWDQEIDCAPHPAGDGAGVGAGEGVPEPLELNRIPHQALP